jgi:hypothetical protein
MQHLLRCAYKYLEAGYAVIPTWPDQRKNPHLSSTKEYTQRLPTKAEWSGWARRWPNANIGLITGYFKRLVCLDFDDELTYDVWRKGVGGVELVTWVVKTGRGYHVWFTVQDQPGKSQNYVNGDVEVLLRAKNGYCIVPPSVHWTGKMYHTVNKAKPLVVRTITDVLPGWVEKHEQEHHSLYRAYIPTPTTVKIEDLIPPVKDQPMGSYGAYLARCPFHEDNNPSAWVNIEEQRFGCNACWPQQWWDTVNVYGMLKHITNGEAYKLLRVSP